MHLLLRQVEEQRQPEGNVGRVMDEFGGLPASDPTGVHEVEARAAGVKPARGEHVERVAKGIHSYHYDW